MLYRLHDLVREQEKDPERWVFVVQGEKDADLLWDLGFVATTNVGGAEKGASEFAETLRGRNVVVLPDNDEAGSKHCTRVFTALREVAKEVRVVELPGLPEKGDVTDWFARGETEARKVSSKNWWRWRRMIPMFIWGRINTFSP